ncbi:MAG: T9SS type A sorting domain-containing protein [Saprospiraceae bacterium]|nr:T9SS type A sorting domain-containing protein [Saprospiraceae bacterium]
MKRLLAFWGLLLAFPLFSLAQIVSLSPSNAGPDDSVILTFNAAEGNGELIGADKVYIHHGVVTDAPDGVDWQYVIGNWGADDGVGLMTQAPGETDIWQIELSPTIREYFGVGIAEEIFRISAVFRSADGNTKGTIAPGEYGWGTVAPSGDYYINLNAGNFLAVSSPSQGESFLQSGETITISASASSEVTSLKIWIDEGPGYVEVANETSGTQIDYVYSPTNSGMISIKFTATINGEDIEVIKPHTVIIVQPTISEALPPGIIPGINYSADPTEVVLVLEAPGKDYAFVVGDFNNWTPQENYQMKQTPDGELFWLTITGLTPLQQYVFQYWVDGTIKIGDAYADQVADPWNDQWIESSTYPDLPTYQLTENSLATVLQTGQTPYSWNASEDNWERPDVNHLVIYELLVRDFLGTHSYEDLIDTLSYIQSLGVDAIELMPVSEFEGNESWGYNPAYYFAPDKYYGPKEDLKLLVETAHQMGMAVIMDMVLNHAFGQNGMVRLYFDYSTGKPAADNPWFNQEYVGPYQWGYDFNHESPYTQAFLDRVNKYWIEEYHVDGYRFDFTKGFTNYAPGGSIDGFDQSRIDILKRMADEIWNVDPEAYVILEHWSPSSEEQILGDYGMKMWRNKSYDFIPATVGANSGNLSGTDAQTHVTFFDSHDERRIAEHALTEGLSNGGYDVKNPLIMYERVKMAAAFAFLQPGPKMIWQFDELGYDIDINFNGRVGNKPLPWGPDGLGYYEDPLRQYIYQAYKGILDVRNQLGAANLASASTNHVLTGNARRLSFDLPGTDLIVIGNFGLSAETIDPAFTQSGIWYEYFSGEEIDVAGINSIELQAGEWHIYTSDALSSGFPGVVEIFDNPVTITPYPFTKSDQITVRFEAAKAWTDGTAGLVGADKVYFHSGVVLSHPDSSNLVNIVGTLTDDGIGLMTEVEDDIWEITLTPKDYYSLMEEDDAYRIGMYFRDAANVNLGKGFRDSDIYFSVEDERPFVTIEPPAFEIEDQITITFNARRGNGELIGADKVYMHSSVDLTNTQTPQNTAWNNVIGNWGADDGVGQMSPVAGETDLWEITLTPKDYYGLQTGDVAFWVAAVFRSADGNIKGTGTPGPIENGFIHTNQDFFLRNLLVVGTEESPEATSMLQLAPNPASNNIDIQLSGFSGPLNIELLDITGRTFKSEQLQLNGQENYLHSIKVSDIPSGIYLIRVIGEGQIVSKEFIKL